MNWLFVIQQWLLANWLGITLSLFGVFVSWFFYKKGLRYKSLTHYGMDIPVIGPNDSLDGDLQIHYKGQNVPMVTKTILAIWNDGTETVNGDDILQSDRFRIELEKKFKILKVSLLEKTRNVIDVNILTEDDNTVEILFDFLDEKDGFSLEILHTGNQNCLKLNGTLKGIPKGFSRFNPIKWFERIFRVLLILSVSIAILIMVLFLISLIYLAYSTPYPKNLGPGMVVLILTICIVWNFFFRSDEEILAPLDIPGVPKQLSDSFGRW